VITKSPEFKRSTTVTGVVGLYDAGKVTVDSTGAITENGPFAYRLIGVYQDTNRNWSDTHLRQKIIDPQITYKLSDRTQITLKYTYADYYSWGDPRVLVDSSVVNNAEAIKAVGFERDGLNGAEGWNGRNSYYNKGDLIVNTSLNDHISMRLAADYLYDRDVSELASLALPGTTNRYNPYTGILTPDQRGRWTLRRTRMFRPSLNTSIRPTYREAFHKPRLGFKVRPFRTISLRIISSTKFPPPRLRAGRCCTHRTQPGVRMVPCRTLIC